MHWPRLCPMTAVIGARGMRHPDERTRSPRSGGHRAPCSGLPAVRSRGALRNGLPRGGTAIGPGEACHCGPASQQALWTRHRGGGVSDSPLSSRPSLSISEDLLKGGHAAPLDDERSSPSAAGQTLRMLDAAVTVELHHDDEHLAPRDDALETSELPRPPT